MYTCLDKESHISRRTRDLLYFPHEINTAAASVEEVRFQQKSHHPSTKAGKAQLRWEDQSGRVERAAMRCMLRQGEDSCWHGSDIRNSRGEGDWNKFSDRLLKRLWRQDYIEPSYGSYTEYPTFMVKKKSAHYALNPNVESSSSRQRLEMPVLCFHQPCLDSGEDKWEHWMTASKFGWIRNDCKNMAFEKWAHCPAKEEQWNMWRIELFKFSLVSL